MIQIPKKFWEPKMLPVVVAVEIVFIVVAVEEEVRMSSSKDCVSQLWMILSAQIIYCVFIIFKDLIPIFDPDTNNKPSVIVPVLLSKSHCFLISKKFQNSQAVVSLHLF